MDKDIKIVFESIGKQMNANQKLKVARALSMHVNRAKALEAAMCAVIKVLHISDTHPSAEKEARIALAAFRKDTK